MSLRLVVTALLLASLGAVAQPAQGPEEIAPSAVGTRLVPESVLLGEPFVFELSLTHPPEHRYELAPPGALGDFELLTQTRQRRDGPQGAVTTFGLTLSAFALGTLEVPPLAFDVTTPEGPRRYVAPGVTVTVTGTLPEGPQAGSATLHDLQPPLEVPVRSWRLLWALAGLVTAGLLAWALVGALRRRRRAPLPAPPPDPLDVRTRRALEALEAQGLPALGRGREFSFQLSQILRAYLGERYGFEALECTSTELMTTLRRLHPSGLPEEALERFVSRSDMVKYAKEEAPPEACRDALAFGYELLEATWPPPPPPAPANAPGPRVP